MDVLIVVLASMGGVMVLVLLGLIVFLLAGMVVTAVKKEQILKQVAQATYDALRDEEISKVLKDASPKKPATKKPAAKKPAAKTTTTKKADTKKATK